MKILSLIILAVSFHFAQAENSTEYNFLLKETSKATKISVEEYKKYFKNLRSSMKPNFTAPLEVVEDYQEAQKKVNLSNEVYADNLEKTLFVKLRKSIESQNITQLQKSLIDQITFTDVNSALGAVKPRTIDGISFFTVNKFKQKSGKETFLKDFKTYLQTFKKIEYVDTKVISADAHFKSSIEQTRLPLLASEEQVSVVVSLEIRGLKQDGFRRVDKALVTVLVQNEAKANLIAEIRYDNFQSLYLDREPSFRQVASNAGFDSGKAYPRLEALRRGGYGFAVEDFNNDGHLDAFVGAYGESTLWIGNASGAFTELKLPEVNKVTLAKAAAFVDLDNDGWKDLTLTRFSADKVVGDIFLFKNDQGTFKEIKNAFPSKILRTYAMPMAIADFNNDGLLDIYIGFPGERDFSAGADQNDKFNPNGLFTNKGNFKFLDETDKLTHVLPPNFRFWPHGSLASDFNHDGQMDIMIMEDQKNLSPIYQNMGTNFQIKNSEIRFSNYGYGMGIAAGDFNQDGLQDYVVTNATFNAQNRLARNSKQLFPMINVPTEPTDPQIISGIRMFLNNPKTKTFEEVRNPGLDDSGEAAGGATVVDYDNDGLQDVYLVNGLWSGSSRDENIDSLFAKATDLGIAHQFHLQGGGRGSKSVFMDVLMKDRVRTGSGSKTMSFAGYQRNRLFKNIGNAEFIEVGYLEAIDSESDGYMSAVADINRDGKPDLLLRNGDPGASDHKFAPVQVFQNIHQNNKSVTIGLKGKKSNSMGIGAKLYATIGNQTHYREIFGNNSAIQGEVTAHFGLGTNDKITKLKLVWPSGTTDTFKNIKPGKYVLTEAVRSIASVE